NWKRYGAPFRTGYGYWAPGSYLGLGHLFGPVNGGTIGNAPFYLASLAGLGQLHPWPVVLLAAFGFGLLLRDASGLRLAALSAGVVGELLTLHLPFFWQAERFLLPAS